MSKQKDGKFRYHKKKYLKYNEHLNMYMQNIERKGKNSIPKGGDQVFQTNTILLSHRYQKDQEPQEG